MPTPKQKPQVSRPVGIDSGLGYIISTRCFGFAANGDCAVPGCGRPAERNRTSFACCRTSRVFHSGSRLLVGLISRRPYPLRAVWPSSLVVGSICVASCSFRVDEEIPLPEVYQQQAPFLRVIMVQDSALRRCEFQTIANAMTSKEVLFRLTVERAIKRGKEPIAKKEMTKLRADS